MLESGSARSAAVVLLMLALAAPGLAGAESEGDRRDFRAPADRPMRGERRDGAPGHFIERHGDELGLSAEVREQIQSISDESRRRALALGEELRVEQVRMRDLLSQVTPDESEVLSQSGRVEALRAQQRTSRLEAMLAIRKLLTPEQREQLAGMRGEGRVGRRREPGDARGFRERDGAGETGRPGKRRAGARGCRDDLAKLCPDAAAGRDRLRCLDAEWESLSDDCRASFEWRGRRAARPERPVDPARPDAAPDDRSPL